MSTIARYGLVDVVEGETSSRGADDVVVVLGSGTSTTHNLDAAVSVKGIGVYLDTHDLDAAVSVKGIGVYLDRFAGMPGDGQLDLIDRLPPHMRGLVGEVRHQPLSPVWPRDLLQAPLHRADAAGVNDNRPTPCPASEIAEVRLTTQEQVQRRDALDARIGGDLDRRRRPWWQRFRRPHS